MSDAYGHVLVTGAAKRIGRVIAFTLAEAGWDVTIHYNTSEAEARSLAQEIKALGRRAFLVQADLEASDCVGKIMSAMDVPLTALVNNASLFEPNASDPGGERHRRVNVEVPLLLTEALAAQLPDGSAGRVVHLLDSTSVPDSLGHYAQSRKVLADVLPDQARRYAPKLCINAVAPGPTLRAARETEEHFARLVAGTPLKRASSPADIAAAVLFLLRQSSMTGQILNVDSGAHLEKFSK